MKKLAVFANLIMMLIALCGCGKNQEEVAAQTVLYGAMAALALLLLIGCLILLKKRELWLTGLFASVSVVNCGYFFLSISDCLKEALWANRIAYLGSVFLPMTMLMIMLKVCRIYIPKWFPSLPLGLAGVVFFITATPGWLPIYYKEVYFAMENGVGFLQKVYGPLHILYLFYLLGYFGAMIAVMIYAGRKRKLESNAHAAILAVAVFANMGVWLFEQLVEIDFEILSVSYIISELFLLGLYLLIFENERRLEEKIASLTEEQNRKSEEGRARFEAGKASLTKTERAVFDLYLQDKNTIFVMEALSITENTLKYHNRNIYAKMGVANRKELIAFARAIKEDLK